MNATYEMTLKSGRTIKATAYGGNKPASWQPSGNHYQVIVTYFVMPGNSKTFRFDFWNSIHNMQAGEPCDVRGALACWAMDAQNGMSVSSVDDIAYEFGYTKPSEALRVFNGVKRAEAQYNRIGMSKNDLEELGDY